MPPYEQKTDSREFEVANRDPSQGARVTDPRADATDMVIRLWARSSDHNTPVSWKTVTWKTDSVLVYMIADLVGASRGRIAEDSPAIMGAHFDGSRQAMVAAKRIQTSILEFLGCRPSERVAAAILIFRPRTIDPTGFSGETVQQALGQATPGQILLAENICERLREVPGIEFHAVPALTTVMGERRTELTELVWTTPERIALLQASAGDEAEPQKNDAPPVGATLIVDSPVGRHGSTRQEVPPVAGTAGSVLKDASQTASKRAGSEVIARKPARSSEDLKDNAPGLLLEGLDELEERPLVTRTRLILGVVALVLVAALIAVLYRPTHVSKVPIPLQQDRTGATENPDTQTPATPEPAARTAEPETVKPTAKTPAVAAKQQPPVKASADRGKKKDIVEEPEIIEESGGLSQTDIPNLLSKAGIDTGGGQYDNARREYRKVLQLQPGNQQAKEGLKKLDRIQNDQK
jgi:hypothetical protein